MVADQPSRVERRLAAILAADVAGYSRLMGLDEAGTARILREHRVVADALVAKHGGRIVRRAEDIWSKDAGAAAANVEDMPAYQAMKKAGADACGLTQLASRTVGVPFVGLIAGVMVIGELLRRLHGGVALELAAGSISALEAIETVAMQSEPYAFGHVSVSR